MRQNLYQTYIRKFHSVSAIHESLNCFIAHCVLPCSLLQVMQEYNKSSYEFKKSLQDRTRRQLKIGARAPSNCCSGLFLTASLQCSRQEHHRR